MGRFARAARRVVIRTVTLVLIIGGLVVAASVAYVYYDDHHGWYVGLVAVLVGVGAALGSWFVAAMISLFVEMADSLRELVEWEEPK
jgi:flagellar biosynthesis protein FliQ